MRLPRLITVFAALAAAVSAIAQLSGEQRLEVLQQVDRVMTREVFVPGVDLRRWRDFLEARRDRLDRAETPSEFASVVNSAFREFGLSHFLLMRDRMRRGWGGEYLQVQRGMGAGRGPELRWLDEETAYIRLRSFSMGYDERAIEGVFERAGDARYLVLDLRGNPGGEVENMRHLLGLLLPSDTPIGTFVSRTIAREYARSQTDEAADPVAIAKWAKREFKPRRTSVPPFAGKVAVLVDRDSASASEIVANAMREARQSPVLGSRTAGAVLVSTFSRLAYGFRIQYPVGDYVSRAGIRLEGRPLTPDVTASGAEAIDLAASRLKSPRAPLGDSGWLGALRTVYGILTTVARFEVTSAK